MQSDHRTIQLTLPETSNGKTKKRWTPPRRREVNDPVDIGERAEHSLKEAWLGDLSILDTRFAEIDKGMPKKTPWKRISQDPRIKELIQKRMSLPRSPDGRQRFQITTEILGTYKH